MSETACKIQDAVVHITHILWGLQLFASAEFLLEN